MKRSNFSRLGLAFAICLGVWGCYPDGLEYYEDTDIVFTQYDVDFDFGARQTYSLPDKIVVDIDIENGDTTLVYMREAYANPILSAIETNMSNNGWTKVAISANPDMVLTPAVTKNTTVFYSYWYDWWYGGWYPGWGWYYPPYYTVSSYTTGTVILSFADPNTNNPVNQSEVSWLMVGNGLASGSNDVSRVTEGINQAFQQSPYLKIN